MNVSIAVYLRRGRNAALVHPCTSHFPSCGPGEGEADKGEGPVNLRPAERACHGRQAPDLQARAEKAERRKPDTAAIRPKAAPVDPSTRGISASLHVNRGAKWFW